LIRATFGDVPNERQREVLHRNRRIGVGHFGYQGWVNKMGFRYSDSHNNVTVRSALKMFKQTVRNAAREYAFALRIPEPVKVTTEAPTGTIAKLFGTTEGIHPVLYTHFERRVRFASNDSHVAAEAEKGYAVENAQFEPNTSIVVYPTRDILIDEVAEIFGEERALEIVESAYDIPLADMLAVQEMVQTLYADNAVSFTINIPVGKGGAVDLDKRWQELRNTLIHYLPRLKGTTVFPEISRPQAPYTPLTVEQYEAAIVKDSAESIDEECAGGSCGLGNEQYKL
jgi:ribonucleoside-triphosphate reductase